MGGSWRVAAVLSLILGVTATLFQLFGVPVAEWLDAAFSSTGFICIVLFGFLAGRWLAQYHPVGEENINLLSYLRWMVYAAIVASVFVLSYRAPAGSGTEAAITGFGTALLVTVLFQSFSFVRSLRDRVRVFRSANHRPPGLRFCRLSRAPDSTTHAPPSSSVIPCSSVSSPSSHSRRLNAGTL